ncbi:pentapeptide repeat-containing protein [Kiloniella spongiae]|uniref:pentapeptide repeat-containing protein n=1 Tax=Kiloniella spongiae TaxID=1489064 RepID=UPI00069BA501|nr:pentapeptide repeat-containing protein [Kiloniella spongiae]
MEEGRFEKSSFYLLLDQYIVSISSRRGNISDKTIDFETREKRKEARTETRSILQFYKEEVNKENLNRKRNWAYSNLSGMDFRGMDLRGTNLEGCNLKNTIFVAAKMNDTNLRRANLEGANMSCADLGEAFLNKTNLKETDFSYANISRANLTNSYVENANFTGARLDRTLLDGIHKFTQEQFDSINDETKTQVRTPEHIHLTVIKNKH